MTRIMGLAVLVLGCARASPENTPPLARSASGQRPAAAANAPSAQAAVPEGDGFVDFVRVGDFRAAARRIDALPQDRASKPEVRYVRARAAMALHDFARARSLFDGLERDLPVLDSDIAEHRAECDLEIGPFDEAARFFSGRPGADAAVKAGLAEERGGALVAARSAFDRAVHLLGSDDDADAFAARVSARGERAKVEHALHDDGAAAMDLRWLAVEASASDPGRAAEGNLGALVPPAHLTSEQQLIRAKKLAEAGCLDDALGAIDAAARTDPKPTPAALERARGLTYYLTRADYRKAAELLSHAGPDDVKEAPHDAFYAARALARAQDDPGAIVAYESLARKFPTSPYADEARYQAARLRFLLGQWDDAAKAYRAYLDSHSGRNAGKFASAARLELGLTFLASHRPRDAVPLFEGLAQRENDALERAELRELQGVALADTGDRDRASDLFKAVIRERPLSFPALAAMARLVALGADAPAPVEPSTGDRPAPPLKVSLPPKAALFARLGFVLDAERDLSRHVSELVQSYAPRGYEALCRAYGDIGAGRERYRVGRVAVKNDALDRAPGDATRWAWECVYPTPYDDLVRAAESRRELPSGLIHAVMRQESAFQTDAISSANAIGLLQLAPGTASRVAKELGMDVSPELLRTPSYNVELGSYYLAKVLRTFGGHIALAAAAYNAGPRAVSRWLETGETLPLDVWVARIPFIETRGYVARVVGNLARYAYLRGGESAIPKLPLTLPLGLRAGPDDY